MPAGLPGNTSQTARLLLGAPSYAAGWMERVVLPQPAAGANWVYQVDGRYYERVLAMVFTLACSAVVATRFPYVRLSDADGKQLVLNSAGSGTTAGNSVTPSLVTGAPAYAQGANGVTVGFLPDLLIPPGWSWQSLVFGLDAGDQFSGVTLLVQRYPSDAAVQPFGG